MDTIVDINNYVTRLLINEYDDIVPQQNQSYFINYDNDYDNNDGNQLFIGITFYNEEALEMKRTLSSIKNRILEIDKLNHNCVIIGDGYKNMVHSMKLYLKELFCSNEEENNLWNIMMNKMEQLANNNLEKTFIIQKVLYDVISEEYNKMPIEGINLCLVLKVNNRKKHNSHQWILSNNGFISGYNNDNNNNSYILLSDCGTIFDKDSLKKIIKYMGKNPNCVGCTGTQQIMTSNEQNMKDNIFSFFLRKIQYVDYMLSHYIRLVAFSSTGYLPVLPGPCTVLRVSDIGYIRDDETPITHYFNTINVPMEQSNIILENVKLAEDRIPSYSIITHNREKVYSTWVNGAIFKSQSEITIRDLLFQRRRWINGSILLYNMEFVCKTRIYVEIKYRIY